MMKKHWSTIRLAGIVIVAGLISCAEAVKPGGVNFDEKRAAETGPAGGWMLGLVLKINFQPPDSATPEGYLADVGEAFGDRGNGFSYGWNLATEDTRERNSAKAPDQRYDTLNHLQKQDTNAVWEIELPTGVYGVYLVAGDPNHTDQINTFDLEGRWLMDPDGEDSFDEYEADVLVRDGRLTLQPGRGAENAKVAFIEITPRTLTLEAK